VVDLGDDLEFVVQTSSFTRDFFYFYIQETTQEAKDLMRFFTEFLPYDETIPKRNLIHSILRNYGLK